MERVKHRWDFRGVFVAFAFLLVPLFCMGLTNSVPWNDDFEGYADYFPLIDGTGGWYASETNCVVRSNYIWSPLGSGTNAAVIPIDVTLSNRFDGASTNNVWIQMDVRPVLYNGEEHPEEVNTNSAVMFYISSNGYFIVRDGTNWSEIVNTAAGKTAAQQSAANWTRLHWRQDYTTKKWDLFANYNLITNNIGFYNTAVEGFSGFSLYNGSVSSSFVDNVSVTNLPPRDLGEDGGDWLPYMWVSTTSMYFNVSDTPTVTNTFRIRKTNGFFNLVYTNTSSTNWVTVLETHGTNSGAFQTIHVVCSAAGVASSTNAYTATIEIVGIETNYGYAAKNSPHIINVTALMGLQPPENLKASDGLFSDKIRVTWNEVPHSDYRIYRNTSDTTQGATIVGETSNNFLEDSSAIPEQTYYYWVRCLRGGHEDGAFSPSDSGWLGVQPPTGVTATDGTYTNLVRISWNAASGAAEYYVERHLINDSMNAERIATTSSTSFDDTGIVEGARYYYWIRSKDNVCLSHQSQPDSGFGGLFIPSGLAASRGDYTNKVAVLWTVSEPKLNGGATAYRLLRAVVDSIESAVLLVETSKGYYDDYQVEPEQTYYYWLQGVNSNAASAFAGAAAGWSSDADEQQPYVYDGLSGNISVTTNRTYSCNWGGFHNEALDRYELAIGFSAGATDVMNWTMVSGSPFTWGGRMTPGKSYYAAVRGVDSNGTAVTDTLYSDGLTCIGSQGSGGELVPVYRLYSYGDEKSTYEHLFTTNMTEMLYLSALTSWQYEGIAWYAFVAQTGDNRPVYRLYCQLLMVHLYTMDAGEYELLSEHDPIWEGEGPQYYAHDNHKPGTLPVYRFYHPGLKRHFFTIDETEHVIVKENTQWGWNYEGIAFYTFPTDVASEFRGESEFADAAVRAAEDAAGTGDLAHHPMEPVDESSTDDAVQAAVGGGGAGLFDEADVEFVPGDYNGDGNPDLAFYELSTGFWYIYFTNGEETPVTDLESIIVQWGGAEFLPVSGDYDGSGVYDMAVYHEQSGAWFVRTVPGDLLIWNETWGGPGFLPVSVDYNADGVSDLAVYDSVTGQWYVRTPTGAVLVYPPAQAGE